MSFRYISTVALLMVFVAATTIGGFCLSAAAGFLALGGSCGIIAYLLGSA